MRQQRLEPAQGAGGGLGRPAACSGYQVDIAATTAKKLQFVIHDFVDGFGTYTGKLRAKAPSQA